MVCPGLRRALLPTAELRRLGKYLKCGHSIDRVRVDVQRRQYGVFEERAEREYLFEQRRYEFGLQRDARRAMQQMTIDARTMELARQSEEKLERARTRQSAFMESRVASCQALNSSASAPQLAEPVRTASY